MEQTKMKFSADGKSAQIIFADGKETDFFTSKAAALEHLKELRKSEKITHEEFVNFSTEVLENEDFPWVEEDNSRDTFPFGLGGVTISVTHVKGGNARGSSFFDGLSDLFFGGRNKKGPGKKQSKKKEGTRLEICPNCGMHASIVLASGKETEDFWSKEEGLEMLKKLREENLVTDEEVVALTEEINNATTISLKAGEAISNMLDLDDFPFSLGLLQILSGSSIMEYDYSDVSEATLVFSKDKTKARIFTTKKTSPEFDNKEDAYKALEMGKEQNVFGDTEYKKVRLEIDQCDLPATPADAKKQKEEVAG